LKKWKRKKQKKREENREIRVIKREVLVTGKILRKIGA